jgi:uncharacterized protein (TIGR03086 family)
MAISTNPDATVTTGQLYVQAMACAQHYLDGVQPEQWNAPTPCSEWDVRQIANHITGENLWAAELFQGKTVEDVGSRLDGDLTGSDPAQAYRSSMLAAKAVVQAPGAMERTCHLSFGDFSGADYASQLFMDTLIHSWDIAKATGQDARLDPKLVEACLPITEEITRQFRGAGVFGEDLTAAAAADPQARLLALVGRQA